MIDPTFFEQISALQTASVPFCIVTIVEARGSVPQVAGARAVFTLDGLHHGTVGGGRIENKCGEIAAELLTSNGEESSRFFRWNIQKDLNMTCGGEVSVYFESHHPKHDWNIVIFGAGHVAQTLVRFLIEFDCRVRCIDTRREWLDKLPDHPRLIPLLVDEFRAGVATIPAHAQVIVMTMGHNSDLPVLKEIADGHQLPLAYLGVIGSKSKAAIIRKELGRTGVTKKFIADMVCPIGDKIGNNTPAEIAFGIVSQLLQLRRAG